MIETSCSLPGEATVGISEIIPSCKFSMFHKVIYLTLKRKKIQETIFLYLYKSKA